MMLTDADRKHIAEIEARADAATVGPWEWEAADHSEVGLGTEGYVFTTGMVLWCDRCDACIEQKRPCSWPGQPDKDFIAHSRNDIPFLIKKIREIEKGGE